MLLPLTDCSCTRVRPCRWRIALAFAAIAWLSGCAALSGVRPEPPEVTLAGVWPVSLSISRQQLMFRLRVKNPNGFELPLEELDLTARFAGEDFATGSSREEVTVPARGEAFVDVAVDAGIVAMLQRFRSMLGKGTLAFDYGVTGTVKLANWPRRIPFDAEGVLDNPINPKPAPASATGKVPAADEQAR